MNALLRDLRYAFRALAKRPMYTVVIVVTLTLGIGLNTVVFTMLNMVVRRPLPYENADRLVVVSGTQNGAVADLGTLSFADLADYRAQSSSFEEIAGLRATSFTLTDENGLERVGGATVSACFFSMLGTEAAAGRLFHPGEDLPGAEHVAVVSDSFVESRFDGDPTIVGQTLTLDGVGFTIVGVLPPRFAFPIDMWGTEVWATTALEAASYQGRGHRRVKVVGCLRPDVTIAEAGTEMRTIAERLAQQFPEVNTGRSVQLAPLKKHLFRESMAALFIVQGFVGMVLLIVCANIGNMFLARNEGRRAEFAIRSALGAGRRHHFRQLLIEALVLASAGGALGLLAGQWTIDVMSSTSNDMAEMGWDGTGGFDWPVVVFTLGAVLVISLFLCAIPAVVAPRFSVNALLKQGAGAQSGGGRRGWLSGLQVAQVALAFVLLVGSSLMLRSFHRLTSVHPGFQSENLLSFQMAVPRSRTIDSQARARLYREIIDRVEEIPGVQSVGASSSLPLHLSYTTYNFAIVGHEETTPGVSHVGCVDSISPEYFKTLGVPLLRGRHFTRQDSIGHPPVMIINEAMAKRYWPSEDPLGERIDLGGTLNDGTQGSFEIVGVVGDLKDTALDRAAEPYMYVPCDQIAHRFAFFTLRISGEPMDLVPAVRKKVAAVTQDEAPFAFVSAEQLRGYSLQHRLEMTVILGMFGAVAVGLSAMGLYGVVSFSVARRTREIGIRIALGGLRGHVLRMVLRQGLKLTAIGLAIGSPCSLALSLALSSQLYEVGPVDPVTFVAVSTLLFVVALLACYLPARRATKVDPMVALRCE